MPTLVNNNGRLINFIAGIQGVAAGGQATINLPVNCRVHRLKLQCAAVNYAGGTGLATVKITGAGNNAATVTPTVVNGVITAAAIVAGGAGYAVNDTITVVDATGVGAVITVTAVSSGAITTMTIANGGTPSPISPALFLANMKHLVNGVNMRDITPDNIVSICQSNGIYPSLGELPVNFTEPSINEIAPNEIFSWDLFGQNTYQIIAGIAATMQQPALTGVFEFDYKRNTRNVGGKDTLFLNPVAQHQFTFNVPAGRFDINTLPITYPIRRMWIRGSTAGQVQQVELYQDGNKVLETTSNNTFTAGQTISGQLQQAYQDYGIQFGRTDYVPANQATALVKGTYNPLSFYDAAYISDPDGRPWKALTVANSMILRVYSAIAQTITVVMETLPGAFQS